MCNASLTIISKLVLIKLKNKNGFGWDNCLKMIMISKDLYDEEVNV